MVYIYYVSVYVATHTYIQLYIYICINNIASYIPLWNHSIGSITSGGMVESTENGGILKMVINRSCGISF